MFDSAKAKPAPDPEVQGRAFARLWEEFGTAMRRERQVIALLSSYISKPEAHRHGCRYRGGCDGCAPILDALRILDVIVLTEPPRHG